MKLRLDFLVTDLPKQNSQGKQCFTQIGSKSYRNRRLVTSDILPMFTQSIIFYIFYCHVLKSTDVWEM